MAHLHKLLIENQIIIPSYGHYGGLAGFQDYGLLGMKIKNNLIDVWKKHFLSDSNIFEVETPILMPYDILKASGHVDRFTDPIIYDKENHCYRADHLIKNFLKQNPAISVNVDNMNINELETFIKKYNLIDIDNPCVKTENLMFSSQNDTYLRPEIAQGIFVNFKKYYEFIKELPFGIAQIGKSFRKEISPKPLLRMREFTQAEIEFFFDPYSTSYYKYEPFKESILPLLSSDNQLKDGEVEKISLEQAIQNKLLSNQIYAYFLAKIYNFALAIGLKPDKIRFRQHLPTEMAHYASCCWDLESLIDGDWIECIGVANRQDYDLKAHSHTNSLAVIKSAPQTRKIIKSINKKEINKRYGKDQKYVYDHINKIKSNQIVLQMMTANILDDGSDEATYITDDNKSIDIILDKDCITIEDEIYYPEHCAHVIEPSFGIDRLLYAIFDQNYSIYNESRPILALTQELSPYKLAIFQLSNKLELLDIVNSLCLKFETVGIKIYTDFSGSTIGKKYIRTDKYGIKYVITVDFETLKDSTITIRNRDDMKQERIPMNIETILKYIL